MLDKEGVFSISATTQHDKTGVGHIALTGKGSMYFSTYLPDRAPFMSACGIELEPSAMGGQIESWDEFFRVGCPKCREAFYPIMYICEIPDAFLEDES